MTDCGVRDRNTNPKFRAADVSAASSGDCAWYSRVPSFSSHITGDQKGLVSRAKIRCSCKNSLVVINTYLCDKWRGDEKTREHSHPLL